MAALSYLFQSIRVVAMIVTIIAISVFFMAQLSHLLTPDLQTYATGPDMTWTILVGVGLLKLASLLRTDVIS